MGALFQLEPGLLAFLAVLASAAGADLGLTLMVLGAALALGWSGVPGNLADLRNLPGFVAALLLFGAEWGMGRYSFTFALWHTFQRWIRVLALGLLAALATTQLPDAARLPAIVAFVLVGYGAYYAALGWQSLLILRERPARARLLAAVAMGVGFSALLLLAVDAPLQAAVGLAALILLSSTQLPSAFRAHAAILRSGNAWIGSLLGPGRWARLEDLPDWAEQAWSAASRRDDDIEDEPRKVAPGVLLERSVRKGWIVFGENGTWFVSRTRPPARLVPSADEPSRMGALHTRRRVQVDGETAEILVGRAGPSPAELDVAFV